jgi:hypothetical protein
VAVICGVFGRLNYVPSSATNRHPRQNASGWRRRVAKGRNMRRMRSANTSHDNRTRRVAHELSDYGTPNNGLTCSASVPAPCLT